MSRTCDCLLKGEQEVPFEGNLEADVVFIAESPGYTELFEGRPLVGKAGIRWENILIKYEIPRSSVFAANAARCRIDKDQYSEAEIRGILKACRPALETCINHIKPKVIVVMGDFALRTITGQRGISKKRGTWIWSTEFNCYVFPIFHPSYTLRRASALPIFDMDIRSLKRFMDNGYELVSDTRSSGNYIEVPSIRFILDKRDISVGIDTETQGIPWADPNSVTISYSVSDEKGKGYNIILLEEAVGEEEADFHIQWERKGESITIPIKYAPGYYDKIEELAELLKREDIKKYMMTDFDQHRFLNLGISEINSYVMDVCTAAHVLDSELYLDASLSFLEQSFTDLDSSYKQSFDSMLNKADMLWSLKEDREAFTVYAGSDADGTLRVGTAVREELLKDRKSAIYYARLVHPVERTVLFNLERNGMLIDTAKLPIVESELNEELTEKTRVCLSCVPSAVLEKYADNLSLNRRRLIADALFSEDGFGLRPLGHTKATGEPVTDQNSLRRLMNRGNKRVSAFIKAKLGRDEINTLLTRYVKNINQYIRPDGRVHPSLSLTFTSSGRVGAREPNTMNIPIRGSLAHIIRQLFVAPPRKLLLKLDLNQSELRWTAHESQDPRMLEAYRNDEDLHVITAEQVMGQQFSSLTEAQRKSSRQKAKPINFGLIYLMSVRGLQEYARDAYGVSMTLREASTYRDTYFTVYGGILSWHERCRNQMHTEGGVRAAFGRFRHLPDLFSDNDSIVAQAERIGVNFKIQNPSSDAVLLAANDMYDADFIDRPEIKLVNFVHDELVFEVDENRADELGREAIGFIENLDTSRFDFTLSVPLKVDMQAGENLAALHEL